VEEALRAGKYAAAHAHGGPGLRPLCVEEGVSTIEHAGLATDDDVALMKGTAPGSSAPSRFYAPERGIEQGDGRQPGDHAEAGRRARTIAGDLPAPSRFRRALRLRHRRGARGHALRAGDAGTLRVSTAARAGSGTRWAAEACRDGLEVGSLVPGQARGPVGSRDDPLADIEALRGCASS